MTMQVDLAVSDKELDKMTERGFGPLLRERKDGRCGYDHCRP
jgi:hypothetical protein